MMKAAMLVSMALGALCAGPAVASEQQIVRFEGVFGQNTTQFVSVRFFDDSSTGSFTEIVCARREHWPSGLRVPGYGVGVDMVQRRLTPGAPRCDFP